MPQLRNRERESYFWLHKQLRFKYACINSAKNRFGLTKDRPLPYYKLLKSREMVNGGTNLVKGPFARHHQLEFGSSGLEFGRIWEEFGSSWQEFGWFWKNSVAPDKNSVAWEKNSVAMPKIWWFWRYSDLERGKNKILNDLWKRRRYHSKKDYAIVIFFALRNPMK